jgi:hypothetical protein
LQCFRFFFILAVIFGSDQKKSKNEGEDDDECHDVHHPDGNVSPLFFQMKNKNIIFRMKTKILVSLVTQVRQKQLALCS